MPASRAWRRIRTIMNVTMPTATRRDHRLELLLLALRQRLVEHLQADRECDAQSDRGGDADPHRPQRRAVSPDGEGTRR